MATEKNGNLVATVMFNKKDEDARKAFEYLKTYKKKQGRFLTALITWFLEHPDELYYDEGKEKVISIKNNINSIDSTENLVKLGKIFESLISSVSGFNNNLDNEKNETNMTGNNRQETHVNTVIPNNTDLHVDVNVNQVDSIDTKDTNESLTTEDNNKNINQDNFSWMLAFKPPS